MRTDFPFPFWLKFREELSENVVAITTRKGLSFIFCFQSVTIHFYEKSQSFKKKSCVRADICLKNQRGGPNRVKIDIANKTST